MSKYVKNLIALWMQQEELAFRCRFRSYISSFEIKYTYMYVIHLKI